MVCCKCCQGCASLCRVFTYGWLIISVATSLSAAVSCEFVTRNDLTIGLYQFSRDGGECMEYSELNGYETGWLHNWAKVGGAMAPILGVLAIVLMSVDCCCEVCCSKFIQAGLVACSMMFQGMTFLIWISDSCFTRKGSDSSTTVVNRGCRIGDGAISSSFAVGLFIVSSFFLCCNPKPDPLCNKRDDDDGEDEDRKKGCCSRGGKEKKADDDKISDENKPAAQEVKEEDVKDPVVAAAVVNEKEKDVEDTNAGNTKDVEEAKDADEENLNQKTVARDEPPNDEEAQNKKTSAVEEGTETKDQKASTVEEGTKNEDQKASAVEEGAQTEDQKEDQDEEAPAIVPVVVAAALPKFPPDEPLEDSMEVEFDEEFGTSQVRY